MGYEFVSGAVGRDRAACVSASRWPLRQEMR